MALQRPLWLSRCSLFALGCSTGELLLGSLAINHRRVVDVRSAAPHSASCSRLDCACIGCQAVRTSSLAISDARAGKCEQASCDYVREAEKYGTQAAQNSAKFAAQPEATIAAVSPARGADDDGDDADEHDISIAYAL